jgi:signal transduction histidine kinase
MGIPMGDHDRMFDRFFRASNAVTSSIAGTGLGLAITQAIVEAHGGTISFDSVESVGSTFSVTLPRVGGAGLESAA